PTRDGVEQRGLARAVRADDGDEVTLVEREVDVVEGDALIDRPREEGLGDVLYLEHHAATFAPVAAAGRNREVRPFHRGTSSATMTSSAVMSFMSLGSRPTCSARKMMMRYRTAPTMTASTASQRKRCPRIAWPMMTEARPTRMRPMPIEMSAKPWYWPTSAPHMPTKPLDSARVSVLV